MDLSPGEALRMVDDGTRSWNLHVVRFRAWGLGFRVRGLGTNLYPTKDVNPKKCLRTSFLVCSQGAQADVSEASIGKATL